MPAIVISILTAIAGSGDILSVDAILKYLGLLVGYLDDVDGGDKRLTALHDHVKLMVKEGRNPTDDEYAGLLARSDVAHERIQKA